MTWHAIGTSEHGGERRPTLVVGGRPYDVIEAAAARGRRLILCDGVAAALDAWDEAAPEIAAFADDLGELARRGSIRPLDASVSRLAPPYRPGRIFAAASNYRDHAQEMGTVLAPRTESAPFIFMKAETSVVGPGDAVCIPDTSSKVDWEVELGVVIGRAGRHIPLERALDHVAGYTVINDVSARDLTRRTDYPFSFDWFRGKSFDTFAPLGPWVVPSACIADPQRLRLQLSVNGTMMQDATTASMIFSIAEQIVYLSGIATLRPGDLLATGTPDGVGMGRGIFLKPGDVMIATIEQIGSLESPLRAAP